MPCLIFSKRTYKLHIEIELDGNYCGTAWRRMEEKEINEL